MTVTYADGRQETRPADSFKRGKRRPARPPRTYADRSGRVTIGSLLTALHKALWREDWETAEAISRRLDGALLKDDRRPVT